MSNFHISQIDIDLPDDGGEVRENCNIDYTLASMSPSWHLRIALSLMAFPRRPKLPENLTYRLEEPGRYSFQYPLTEHTTARVYIERRRDNPDYERKEEGWLVTFSLASDAQWAWTDEYGSLPDEAAKKEWFARQPELSHWGRFAEDYAEVLPTLEEAVQYAMKSLAHMQAFVKERDDQAWLDSQKEPIESNLRTAFPRRPQLPEGITYTSTEPGLYYFTYPLNEGIVANVRIMREQEQDDDFNTSGPYMWSVMLDFEGGRIPSYLQEKEMYRSLSEAVTRTIAALDSYKARMENEE